MNLLASVTLVTGINSGEGQFEVQVCYITQPVFIQ